MTSEKNQTKADLSHSKQAELASMNNEWIREKPYMCDVFSLLIKTGNIDFYGTFQVEWMAGSDWCMLTFAFESIETNKNMRKQKV